MKILHIAHERGAALVAAPVLHAIAQNVALAWVRTPAFALQWLQVNRDTAAVIIDEQADHCAPFVEQLRGLGLTTPVVVVAAAARLEAALAVFNSGADGYVVAGPSLETDLSRTVNAAIEGERSRRQLLTQTLVELRTQREPDEQRARLDEARRQAEQRSAAELASAEARLADVRTRYSVSLARESRICVALQQRLFELEIALRKADERRASEAAQSADQLAKRHAEFTASLAQTAQSRDAVAAELNVATAALNEERQARRADATEAAEHLRRREAELRADLSEALVTTAALESALAEAEASHQAVRQRASLDLDDANERHAALEDLLKQEIDRRTSLERSFNAAEAARREADQRHAVELTRARAELADLQVRYEAALEEGASARASFDRQIAEATSALERASRERTAEAAAAAAQFGSMEAELSARLAEAAAEKMVLERTLSEARSAHQHATRRGAEDLAFAVARQAALGERLAAETERAAGLEQRLSAAETVLQETDRRHASELAAAETRLASLQTGYDTAVTDHAAVRAVLEQRLTEAENELQRVSAEYSRMRQSLDRLQSAFHTLEQVAGEHEAERARLETVVADRDSQLSAQAEHYRLAEQDAQVARAELQERLRQALEIRGAEGARLQQEIDALHRELESSRTHTAALRGVAERVPDLQMQLDRSQNERRRQFECAPYALCRCTQGGAITEANHSFVTLLGCRHFDELRNLDFVTAALDSAGDLGWLLERARTTRKTETVETHWKTREGHRLVVRLQALASRTGSIDIVVQDITAVRALEERLRQAERMEAVGRLASEVAVTCDGLLSDVSRGAHEWLGRIGSDDPLRRHAERLLTDVTRAAGFLRQLEMYGNEQVRALEPVSAQRVLRDLAPVMKRLVGDQIELVLPKSAGPFNVDVDAERLERVFINVAAYARERISSGGRVRIDLATTAVGRRFAARYSNVRPGDHVLITVTELPAVGQLRGDGEHRRGSSDKPGVELGVLVDLIASCGGHLWLEAQPAGNMVVKIHLPKAPSANVADGRGGRLSRWFRSASTANVGA